MKLPPTDGDISSTYSLPHTPALASPFLIGALVAAVVWFVFGLRGGGQGDRPERGDRH